MAFLLAVVFGSHLIGPARDLSESSDKNILVSRLAVNIAPAHSEARPIRCMDLTQSPVWSAVNGNIYQGWIGLYSCGTEIETGSDIGCNGFGSPCLSILDLR